MDSIKDKYLDSIHFTVPILQTENLSIGYYQKSGDIVLEESLNMEIYNGELVCLIGPNGCGKSTLMRTIAGLQKAISGRTVIAGVPVKKLPAHKYAQLLSLVLTDKVSVGSLTVFDIVAIGRYPYINRFAKLSKADCEIIDQSIEMLHLSKFRDRFYDDLSDGEKQRVMIAKALAQNTPLIILDEPTAHLDLPNRVKIMNILKQLARDTKKAILLSTHELDLALQTADSIWLMNRKYPMIHGAPEDLVLNGSFETVFSGDAYAFDKMSGAFKVNHIKQSEIYLKGKGEHYIWTKKALERAGFYVVQQASVSNVVEVLDTAQWNVSLSDYQFTCESIQELLCKMRHADCIIEQDELKVVS